MMPLGCLESQRIVILTITTHFTYTDRSDFDKHISRSPHAVARIMSAFGHVKECHKKGCSTIVTTIKPLVEQGQRWIEAERGREKKGVAKNVRRSPRSNPKRPG